MRNPFKMSGSRLFLDATGSFGESNGRKTCGSSLQPMGNRDQLASVLASQRALKSGHIFIDAIMKPNDDFPGQPLVSEATMQQLWEVNG